MSRNRLRIFLLIGYIFVIFFTSSIPGLHPPGSRFVLNDKIAHLLEYLVLGGLLFSAIRWQVSRSRLVTMAFLFAVGVSIGALDEIYQSFIPNRSMSIFDWIADAVGVSLGVGIFVFTALGRQRSRGVKRESPAEEGKSR